MFSRVPRMAGALLAALATGTAGCSANTPLPAPAPLPASPFRCGIMVPPSRPSSPKDSIYIRITGVSAAPESISVRYEITATRALKLLIPIGPTAPTLLLVHRGKVAAAETRPFFSIPSGTADGTDPAALSLTPASPYRSRLTITRLCAGFSWPDVANDHSAYRVELVVSRQFPYPPSQKLIRATAAVSQGSSS